MLASYLPVFRTPTHVLPASVAAHRYTQNVTVLIHQYALSFYAEIDRVCVSYQACVEREQFTLNPHKPYYIEVYLFALKDALFGTP